jgi:hypothetical protein
MNQNKSFHPPMNAGVPNAMLLKDRMPTDAIKPPNSLIRVSLKPHALQLPAALHLHRPRLMHLFWVLEKPALCFINQLLFRLPFYLAFQIQILYVVDLCSLIESAELRRRVTSHFCRIQVVVDFISACMAVHSVRRNGAVESHRRSCRC